MTTYSQNSMPAFDTNKNSNNNGELRLRIDVEGSLHIISQAEDDMGDDEWDSIPKVEIEDRNYNNAPSINVRFWKGVSCSVQLRFAVGQSVAGAYRLLSYLLFDHIPSDACFTIHNHFCSFSVGRLVLSNTASRSLRFAVGQSVAGAYRLLSYLSFVGPDSPDA